MGREEREAECPPPPTSLVPCPGLAKVWVRGGVPDSTVMSGHRGDTVSTPAADELCEKLPSALTLLAARQRGVIEGRCGQRTPWRCDASSLCPGETHVLASCLSPGNYKQAPWSPAARGTGNMATSEWARLTLQKCVEF